MKHYSLAAALMAVIALPALAQTATPRADVRQSNQAQRIEQGVASGQLNAREAARMEAGQARVEAIEDNAKADGVVTKKERARLKHAQNVESKRIHRQKHDSQ